MKINNVRINNWQPPGDKWWSAVEARPLEPLIDATVKLTLSWSEYMELLSRDEHKAKPSSHEQPMDIRNR